jgi:hypothetical protein
MTFADSLADDPEIALAVPAGTLQSTPTDPQGDWCARVAQGSLGRAKDGGMDAATQRIASTNYTQCMAMASR